MSCPSLAGAPSTLRPGNHVPTRKDFYDGVKVLGTPPSIHGLRRYTPYFASKGVPPVMGIRESLAGKIRNSGKFYSGQELITEG